MPWFMASSNRITALSDVYSEPGLGATFRIYLPVARGNAAPEPKVEKGMHAGGTETILLVEDEGSILNVATKVLRESGYTVLAASSPGEAIDLAREHMGGIDLMVTDVIMPEMNGKDLRDEVVVLRPDVKILFMSGYTADAIANRGVMNPETNFLQKPFSINDLKDKVRQTLDSA